MNPIQHRIPRTRRSRSTVVMLAALLLGALTLSQCRMMDQTITGVDTPSAAANGRHSRDCSLRCWTTFKLALKKEIQRDREAKRACDHDRECLEKERRRHQQNLKAITEQMRACKAGCYSEGSGRGGR